VLFAAEIIAVGFLAVPVMTAGVAYDLVQSLGLRRILHAKFHEARGSMNLLGWITTAVIFLASAGLVATWFI
jgi:hypothetical protein